MREAKDALLEEIITLENEGSQTRIKLEDELTSSRLFHSELRDARVYIASLKEQMEAVTRERDGLAREVEERKRIKHQKIKSYRIMREQVCDGPLQLALFWSRSVFFW